MKSYPFSSATYQVPQLADELVAAGVPMGGEGRIDWNFYPLATSITIWANDSAVDATVNATVAAHVPPSQPGGSPVAFTAFSRDLGAARRSGRFELTGLSGLTANKPVMVMQTAAPIASKGNAEDEPEMDRIEATGFVVNATTIRIYWHATSVVVGDYSFAYFIGA